jgi:hypothetical protein
MTCSPRALVVVSILAVGLVWLADFAADPLPIPTLLAVAGMLCGLWLGRGARRVLELGLAGTGLFIGVGYHLWIHLSGRSVPPREGLPAHLLLDMIEALAWAAAIAALLLLAGSLLCRRDQVHLLPRDPR